MLGPKLFPNHIIKLKELPLLSEFGDNTKRESTVRASERANKGMSKTLEHDLRKSEVVHFRRNRKADYLERGGRVLLYGVIVDVIFRGIAESICSYKKHHHFCPCSHST